MASILAESLTNAKADLVIEYHDGRVLIVDFKTTAVTRESARVVCEQRGYTEQVRTYANLYARATGNVRVDGAIVFTGSQVIVALGSDHGP
jgi:ATP-dependent exoDNAse (exonuclease V) beta subunit